MDVEHVFELGRRRFVKAVGMAVLAVQSRPLLAHASAHSAGDEVIGNDLVIQSGPGLFSHVHDLLIPSHVLETPPPHGVELTTSEAMLHSHTVALTQEQLRIVSRGGLVTKKASSHVFAITLASMTG